MNTTLNPYLFFDGQTRDSMKFYESIFGGKLEMQTFADSGMDSSPEMADKIIHAALSNDMFSIMASDIHPEQGAPLSVGNNVNLSLNGSDNEKLTEYFNKLADGGKIEMKLEKQFWGDVFGSCEDKFGIHWMINISAENK